MRIVVCVKHVPDAQADRTFTPQGRTDRAGVDGLLSELDEYAVEEALKVSEATEAEVVVLTMGPPGASAAIRKALQMGAHRGVHVQDDLLEGSDAPATSLVLAAAVTRIATDGAVDLVLTGMASTDGSMGVVAAMLAERLGLPQVTFASELSVADGSVTIRRDGDASTETITAALPAVVSVTDQINEPRYPSFKGIMAAKKKPVDVWSTADLGIEPAQVGASAAWTAVASITPRPPRQGGEVVTDSGEGGLALARFLLSHKLV